MTFNIYIYIYIYISWLGKNISERKLKMCLIIENSCLMNLTQLTKICVTLIRINFSKR